MPMGLVNDSEFEKELNDSVDRVIEPKVITGEVIDYSKGRGHNPEVPDSLRKIIGETSELEGRGEAVDLANRFGISPSSVSAYANGATSTASYDKRPNLAHINDSKKRITKRAMNKLHKALNAISDDKLEDLDAPKLAGVAKDMSAIVKNMEPEKETEDPRKNGPTFVFYSPQTKTENHFEVIYAKE